MMRGAAALLLQIQFITGNMCPSPSYHHEVKARVVLRQRVIVIRRILGVSFCLVILLFTDNDHLISLYLLEKSVSSCSFCDH